jgi:hypothetical protein
MDACIEPSGLSKVRANAYAPPQNPGIVAFDTSPVTTCPGVPLKVKRAF